MRATLVLSGKVRADRPSFDQGVDGTIIDMPEQELKRKLPWQRPRRRQTEVLPCTKMAKANTQRRAHAFIFTKDSFLILSDIGREEIIK